MLLVLATNTWNAYNNWGGRSLYTGAHEVSFDRPWGRGMLVRPEVDRRRPQVAATPPATSSPTSTARRIRRSASPTGSPATWARPAGSPTSGASSSGRRRAGLELDYAISSDLEHGRGLTEGYRLVIGAGHDEYWSAGGRDTIEAFVADGGNYASFSGNTMFWQVRLERRRRSMVCHKYSAAEHRSGAGRRPGAMTGMWCDPMVGRPERRFLGAASMYGLYSRFGRATPRGVAGIRRCTDPTIGCSAGTGLRYGDVLGADDGVVGYETVGTRFALDELNLPVAVPDPCAGGRRLPDDVEIVALTPVSNLAMGEYPESIAALDDQGDLEFIAERVYGGGETSDRQGPPRQRRDPHLQAVRRSWRAGGDGRQHRFWVFGLAEDVCVKTVTQNAVIASLLQVRPN